MQTPKLPARSSKLQAARRSGLFNPRVLIASALCFVGGLLAIAAMDQGPYQRPGITERVSVQTSGAQAIGGTYGSYYQSISADGRYVLFWSDATNLVPGDTNGTWDVFLHDRQTGVSDRGSVASNCAPGNDNSAPA